MNLDKDIGDSAPEVWAYMTIRVKVDAASGLHSEEYYREHEYLKEDFMDYKHYTHAWEMDEVDLTFKDYLKIMESILERELLISLLTKRSKWYTRGVNKLIKNLVKEITIMKDTIGIFKRRTGLNG